MYFTHLQIRNFLYFFWNKHICLLKPTFGFRKTHLHFENHIVENHMWVSDICVLKTVSDFWNTYVFFKNQIIFFDKHFQFWKIIVFESCDQNQMCILKNTNLCYKTQMWWFSNVVFVLKLCKPKFGFWKPYLFFQSRICVLKHKLKNRP